MSWNFHGTLHMGSENLDYQMEKLQRRPHRQRVTAIVFVGLAAVLMSVGWVHSPRPNVSATVTDVHTLASGDVQVDVEYVDPTSGRQQDGSAVLPPGGSVKDHHTGSQIEVHATADAGGRPVVAIPRTHVLQGVILGLLALGGAVLLLAAAQRNGRRLPSPDRRDYRLFPGPGMGKRRIS